MKYCKVVQMNEPVLKIYIHRYISRAKHREKTKQVTDKKVT